MNNRKLSVTLTLLLIVIFGSGLLWFGFSPSKSTISPILNPSPALEKIKSASSSAFLGIQGERAQVTKVVDGDTIDVSLNGKIYPVRLVGMNTPETVDPRKPVECFGKEASNETKSLLTGKTVILQKDVSDVDKYKRLLRYVFLPLPGGQILFVDDYLVREGFATVLNIPPDSKYNVRLMEAQNEAKQAKKGLWGAC